MSIMQLAYVQSPMLNMCWCCVEISAVWTATSWGSVMTTVKTIKVVPCADTLVLKFNISDTQTPFACLEKVILHCSWHLSSCPGPSWALVMEFFCDLDLSWVTC